MTAAQHIHALYIIVAALIACNALTAVVAILAWRWRPPGAGTPARLSFVERKIMELVG
jgi:hypothetical protein